MLTGKVKNNFEIWLENQNVAPYKAMFYDIPKIVQYSYIIEYFDSIGIYIFSKPIGNGFFGYGVQYNKQEDSVHLTRSEAIEKAIGKVNELLNLNK